MPLLNRGVYYEGWHNTSMPPLEVKLFGERHELKAFAVFAKLYPRTVLLVDTYDTLQGVRNAIELARPIGEDCRLTGVRLDSENLGALSRAARAMLDEADLQRLKIVASGGLNELRSDALVREGARIDIFVMTDHGS